MGGSKTLRTPAQRYFRALRIRLTARQAPRSGRLGPAFQALHGVGVVFGQSDLRRPAGRAEVGEEIGVDLQVLALLGGQVVFVIDGLDRAHGLAGAAVDALV